MQGSVFHRKSLLMSIVGRICRVSRFHFLPTRSATPHTLCVMQGVYVCTCNGGEENRKTLHVGTNSIITHLTERRCDNEADRGQTLHFRWPEER